uniref:Butyrophilin-like protein 1 n=1 Tax=Sparus aurata TaxID=8175 RepID=A0A671X8Y4_SPAAU
MELLPLVCLCLLSCSGDGVRVVVEEDSDAVLPCSPSTKEDITAKLFDWKKDGQEVFMYDSGIHYNNGHGSQDLQFKGRVSHFQDQLMNGNASIKIQNVKMADSGNYICIFPRLQPRQTFNIELVVGVKVVVEEDSDAVLPCLINTKEDITLKLFDWKKDGQKEVFMYDAGNHYNNGHGSPDLQFKGRVSHFQDQLMNGNASIKIQNTKMADSGNYICIFPRLQPRQTFNIELVVGASPEPYITTLNETKDWSLLQCKVRGASQEPKVEWQDSSGNILPAEEPQVSERGGRYYVTINTTVTKTGRYRCVVTQKEINHQSRAETFVFISGASPEPYITTPDATKDWSLLQCEVKGASPEPKVEWQDSSGNILPAEEPQVSERGGRYYVTIKTNVTKTGRYRCVVTQEGISHQTSAETFVFINVNSSSVSEKVCEDCSSAVAFVLGAAVLAVVVAAVPFGLRATNCITVSFNQGAAPDPTTTSNDPTKDIPLLQVRVTGDHQDQNGSSNAP